VAHLAHTIMDMEDTDAVFLLIGMADKIVIVARSKAAELNVGRWPLILAGRAPDRCVGDYQGYALRDRRGTSSGVLRRNIRPMKVAMDVMTTPVKIIQSERTVKEAEDMIRATA